MELDKMKYSFGKFSWCNLTAVELTICSLILTIVKYLLAKAQHFDGHQPTKLKALTNWKWTRLYCTILIFKSDGTVLYAGAGVIQVYKINILVKFKLFFATLL